MNAGRYRLTMSIGIIVLAACGPGDNSSDEPGSQESAAAVSAAAASAALDPKPLRVTVDEGTNLAVALSPGGEQLAISLQGMLFTLPASGGKATAITDLYHDAREPDWSLRQHRNQQQQQCRRCE